jgi:predicted RNA-binding Zn ribbon-like protein
MGPIVRADRADLCLEFANTKFWRGRDPVTETLPDADALLEWCARNAALDAEAAKRLRVQWKRQPQEAADVFGEAISLREALFPLFAAIARGAEPASADLAALNKALEQAPARKRLRRMPEFYGWQTDVLPRAAPELLAAVLWSAGDLIAGTARRERVRICANPICQWLFLDDSKSGTRRWCAMSACGNRAKAHRHYQRHKETRQAE